jgi:hypothetical protein
VGGVFDAKTKRDMCEILFDSKTKNFLFVRNPKLMLETWKLDQESAVGMGITGGKPGEDYFKVHYLKGEKQRAEVTYWDEKGFLSGAYLNKIKEYQKVLETKYKFKDDILFYYALSSTNYVESNRKAEEWVSVLQKNGLSFQTSNSLNNVILNKITYTKGKQRLDVEFGSRYGNNLYGITASYPLSETKQLKMGLTSLDKVMFGEKNTYTINDPFAINGMGVLFNMAKWEKEGIKQIQNVQAVNVDELPKDSAAYTLFAVMGGTRGTAAVDKQLRGRLFVAAETGFIVRDEKQREDLFPQARSAGAVYYTREALDAIKNEKKGVTLFVGIERNTGTVFITTNEPDKPKDVEDIYRLGIGYYKIQPGKIWRVDATVEKKDDKMWYTASTSLVTPQAMFWVKGTGSPGTSIWEAYAGVSVKFNGDAIDKTVKYMIKPFSWVYEGGKYAINQLKQAQK